MPSLIGSLYVSLTADFSGFQRNMRSAEGVVASTTAGIRRNTGLTEKSVTALHKSFNHGIRPGALIAAGRSFDSLQSRTNLLRGSVFALTAAFGGLGAALTTNVVSRYLDTFTGLENQMRVVSRGSADLAAQIGSVGRISERSRSSLAAVATLYSRMQKASPLEAVSRTMRRVETINKGLQLGGATAQESASAAIQFSQAIASNRLGGEELRAVLETPLGLELAKGLGVTIGKLREMGFAGELTAEKLFGALDKIAVSIDRQFANSVSTIDQALTVAYGKLAMYAGRVDDAYSVTKKLTGAISGFANNLDTIVPILGSVGIGLGSAFAGRLVGGIASRRAMAIKNEVAARRDALRVAKEEAAAARTAADASLVASRQIGAVGPDRAKEFADPAAVKRYQRDLVALGKEEKRYIGIVEDRRNLLYRIGQVTTQTTVGAVKAADKLAQSESKLIDLQSKSLSLKTAEAAANARVNATLGQQSQNSKKISAVAVAQKDLAAVQKARGKIALDIAAQEAAVASRQLAVTNLRTEAERRAARERATMLVQEKRLTADIAASQSRRGLLSTSLGAASNAVRTTGLQNLNARQIDAAQGVIRAEMAAQRAAAQLSAATRAAGGFAVAGAVVGRAWSGLLGVFGGPAGLAFSALIAGLTVVGMRAAKTAEQIARARRIISEELGTLSEEGRVLPASEQKAVLSDKILSETERMRDVAERLQDIQSEFLSSVNQRIFRDVANDNEALVALGAAVNALTNDFEAGKVTFSDFLARLKALGVADDILDGLKSDLKDAIIEGDSAAIVLGKLRERVAQLDGMRASISIELIPVDPLGVLSGKRQPIFNGANLAKQYELYGRGKLGMTEALEMERKRRALLEAAGDTGNKRLNTPAKINEREQQLLEQGYARTREEARALATEELNLAEKTRLAGQSASAATKEYEKFSNMIAELRQEASGAFLSDLDQKVLDKAKTLKDGSKMMADYIAAINSGDLSKAPKELLEVRDALQQIGAASTWKNIIDKYGEGAQLTGLFADRQAQLNYLVASGRITASQAAQDWADFVGQFKEAAWIDKTADALTNFVDAVATDFDNIEDAFKNLLKSLARIALEEAVLNPLREALRGFFASAFGGGATGAGNQSLAMNTFGTGGGGILGIFGSLFKSASKNVTDYFPAAASAVSSLSKAAGSALGFGGNFKSGVDSKLMDILSTAAQNFGGYKVTATSGLRIGDSRFHGKGMAADVQLTDLATGKALSNYQNASTFRAYEQFAQVAKNVQMAKYPELDSKFRWGGYFSGPKGKYGALDTMHFDTAGAGMKGGSWAGGLTAAQRGLWPGAESVGMASKSVASSLAKIPAAADATAKGLTSLGSNMSNAMQSIGGGGGGFMSSFFSGVKLPRLLSDLSPLARKAVMGSVGLFHGGGTVGADGGSRTVSLGAFAGAKRFHGGMGIRSNELPAILEKGEEVLRRRTAVRTSNVMHRLIAASSAPAGSANLNVYIDGANGDNHVRKLASEGAYAAIAQYNEQQRRGGSNAAGMQFGRLKA